MSDRKTTCVLLSSEEKKKWETQGFLLLRNVLEPATIEFLKQETLSLLQLPREKIAPYLGYSGNEKDINLVNIVDLSSLFDPLLDCPAVFKKILGLMGPYLRIQGTESMVRYHHTSPPLKIHTDGGPSLSRVFPNTKGSTVFLKVQFFLTDLSEPNHGNMAILPGSHVEPFDPVRDSSVTDKYIQVCAKPGDAIIFPWSLWHGAMPNYSQNPRVSVIMRYSQLWCMPLDYHQLAQETLGRLTRRQRYLFGEFSKKRIAADNYYPQCEDYLDVMYGTKLRDTPDFRFYTNMQKFTNSLYPDVVDI